MNTNYQTDNRWSPGASGATVPDDAPAAYSGRWIDLGDTSMADIVPDRQGFAYNDPAERERLNTAMGVAGHSFRIPHAVGLDQRDVTTVVHDSPLWKAYMRRAGGYIYVDAWLAPDAPVPIGRAVEVPMVLADMPERSWRVRCMDNHVRHQGTFPSLTEARKFADTGHACLSAHLFEEVWS